MMQPRRWWWGLAPLALLALLAGVVTTPRVEQELAARTASAAAAAGQPWAQVTVAGRDARLAGIAETVEGPDRALAAVDAAPGIRLVTSGAGVIPELRPYTWGAAREGERLTLTGHVPSSSERAARVAAARAALPGAAVVDQMVLARGAPASYAAATAFAVAQLARLPDGRAALSDGSLTITGAAPDAAAFEAATAAAAPPGVTLAQTITPPVAAPWIWQAAKTPAGLTLSGVVPSLDVRASLAELARQAAGGAPVTDETRLASGAPEGFADLARAALSHLAPLREGVAALRDRAYSLTGAAPSQAILDTVMQAVRSLPGGFSMGNAAVTAPPPPPPPATPAPALLSPWVWSAERTADSVTLSGGVPSEAERAAHVVAAGRLPGVLRVADRQEVRSGAPEGVGRITAVALAQLGGLRAGVARLENAALSLRGEAASAEVRDAVVGALRQLPAGFGLGSVEITAPQAALPSTTPQVVVPAPPPAPAPVIPVPSAPAPAPAGPGSVAITIPLPPPPAPALDPCVSLFFELQREEILFDTASATLSAEARPVLDRAIAIARSCPERSIEVAAHTDSDGEPEANLRLSEARARAVVAYLVAGGIDAARLSAVGYGESRPVVPNDTPENKRLNRRVEFNVR